MKTFVVALIAAAAFAGPAGAQQSVPSIAFTSVPNPLVLPAGWNFGEASGVAVNSKGHIFVFSRGNTSGPAYGAAAAQLLEFDQTGKYVREIGRGSTRGRTRTP